MLINNKFTLFDQLSAFCHETSKNNIYFCHDLKDVVSKQPQISIVQVLAGQLLKNLAAKQSDKVIHLEAVVGKF